MNIKLDILADIIEKGLMKTKSIRDLGVISEENRASASAPVYLCLEADAIKGVVKVARPITKGFEYKDLFGDVNILRLDILEERGLE